MRSLRPLLPYDLLLHVPQPIDAVLLAIGCIFVYILDLGLLLRDAKRLCLLYHPLIAITDLGLVSPESSEREERVIVIVVFIISILIVSLLLC